MIYIGTFKDNGIYHHDRDVQEEYKVTISTRGIGTTHNIIDPIEEQNLTPPYKRIYFAPDPVHINVERNDLTQHIVISQCTVRLKVTEDMSDILLANTNRDISVTIERVTSGRQNAVLFFGYVDPLQFDQEFAYDVDEIELHCTDPLGALNDLKIDQTNIAYTDSLLGMTFIYNIIDKLFEDDGGMFNGLSYRNTSINPNDIKINASVFFGEDESDRMTLYDTLDEILKYLGMTLCYEPNGKLVSLYNIYAEEGASGSSQTWFDAKEDAMDDSASLSVDDAYSKIQLTCDIEPNDDDINLIDSDNLYSDFDNYQKYMTEMVAGGNSRDALTAFSSLITNGTSINKDAYTLDHYCYVKRNDAWDFGDTSYITYMGGTEGTNKTPMTGDQSNVLRWLKANSMRAAFISFGKGNKINMQDNSPVNNIPMTDYLVISINGQNDQRATGGHAYVNHNSMVSNAPLCRYKGLDTLALTPTDREITNYIVISGKMILNPLQRKTGYYWDADQYRADVPSIPNNLYTAYTNTFNDALRADVTMALPLMFGVWWKAVDWDGEGDKAYYTQKWWTCSDPLSGTYTFSNNDGIYDVLENSKNQMLKYGFSIFDDYHSADKMSKLPILACSLKVGDKYCVERLDLGLAGQGVFEWMTEEEWRTVNNGKFITLGFDQPYFTIGIDPKVDDLVVGQSFNIQNNIDHTMNLDASGTAIPITIDDQLNGQVEFSIIGPLMADWNEQTFNIMGCLFGYDPIQNHKCWVLETLQSILISDFKIEFKSDNGKRNSSKSNEDKDLIYVSDTQVKYIEVLDQDLKICTPLTMDECEAKGIKYQISNSYVYTPANEPFYGWTIGDDKVKPEQLMIDYLYKQYNKPAKIIQYSCNNGFAFGEELINNGVGTGTYLGLSSLIAQYTVSMQFPGTSSDKEYYCMSMDWSLQQKTNDIKFREKLAYDNPFTE